MWYALATRSSFASSHARWSSARCSRKGCRNLVSRLPGVVEYLPKHVAVSLRVAKKLVLGDHEASEGFAFAIDLSEQHIDRSIFPRYRRAEFSPMTRAPAQAGRRRPCLRQ